MIKKIGITNIDATANEAPVSDIGEYLGIFCISIPPVASKILASMHNNADSRLEDKPIVEFWLVLTRKIRPKTPIKNPSHLFAEIFSLSINLANTRMNRGMEDKYIATSPVVRFLNAKGIKINGIVKQKIPYIVA